MSMWVKIALVAIFGGLGAVCRLLVESVCRTSGTWMGLATLIVNTVGCLLIGIFAGIIVASSRNDVTKTAFTMITMTGFCGGFSTFSSFTLDCVRYFEAGHIGTWVIFGSLTVFLGLFCCALGYWLGTKIYV